MLLLAQAAPSRFRQTNETMKTFSLSKPHLEVLSKFIRQYTDELLSMFATTETRDSQPHLFDELKRFLEIQAVLGLFEYEDAED